MWLLKQFVNIGFYGNIYKYFRYWKFQWNKCVVILVEYLYEKNIDLDYEFSNLKLQSVSIGRKGILEILLVYWNLQERFLMDLKEFLISFTGVQDKGIKIFMFVF